MIVGFQSPDGCRIDILADGLFQNGTDIATFPLCNSAQLLLD